jgi:2-polyprenyl-6-methoxyphenol hydroxylase-like FAD-dependent oxidoreductase
VHEVTWGSRFRVHHRIADTYRAGRILLAGDAAHVHSPAGGQGIYLGIEDAISLGETLAEVLGGAGPEVLDAWAGARRPVAEKVVRRADRLTKLATASAAKRRCATPSSAWPAGSRRFGTGSPRGSPASTAAPAQGADG